MYFLTCSYLYIFGRTKDICIAIQPYDLQPEFPLALHFLFQSSCIDRIISCLSNRANPFSQWSLFSYVQHSTYVHMFICSTSFQLVKWNCKRDTIVPRLQFHLTSWNDFWNAKFPIIKIISISIYQNLHNTISWLLLTSVVLSWNR